MSEHLVEYVDPFRFATTGEHIQASVKLDELPRLCMLLTGKQGEVEAEFIFGIGKQGARTIDLHLVTTLWLECQRCLEPMPYEVDVHSHLALLRPGRRADAIDEPYEPLLIEDNRLVLRELIEDELMLALPLITMHARDDCRVKIEVDEPPTVERENPFAVLKGLKDKV